MTPPQWLWSLFGLRFFDTCSLHASWKRNECNLFCVTCTPNSRRASCRVCMEEHDAACPGPVFQIRKYMYQICIHVEDLQSLLDISGIQAYLINSKRAVLVHPKTSGIGSASYQSPHETICRGCKRQLRSDCLYCSLFCKFGATDSPRSPTRQGASSPAKRPAPSTPPVSGPASSLARIRTTPVQPGHDPPDAGVQYLSSPRSCPDGGPLVLRPTPVSRGLSLDSLLQLTALATVQGAKPPVLCLHRRVGAPAVRACGRGPDAAAAYGARTPSAAGTGPRHEPSHGPPPTFGEYLINKGSSPAAAEGPSSGELLTRLVRPWD